MNPVPLRHTKAWSAGEGVLGTTCVFFTCIFRRIVVTILDQQLQSSVGFTIRLFFFFFATTVQLSNLKIGASEQRIVLVYTKWGWDLRIRETGVEVS